MQRWRSFFYPTCSGIQEEFGTTLPAGHEALCTPKRCTSSTRRWSRNTRLGKRPTHSQRFLRRHSLPRPLQQAGDHLTPELPDDLIRRVELLLAEMRHRDSPELRAHAESVQAKRSETRAQVEQI